jgi:hypothetical protein
VGAWEEMVPVRAFREVGKGGVRVKKEINVTLFFCKIARLTVFSDRTD